MPEKFELSQKIVFSDSCCFNNQPPPNNASGHCSRIYPDALLDLTRSSELKNQLVVNMFSRIWLYALTVTVAAATIVFPASAQTSLDGQVIFASEPLVSATVTLWRASAGWARADCAGDNEWRWPLLLECSCTLVMMPRYM
jgi:hypothetical protein